MEELSRRSLPPMKLPKKVLEIADLFIEKIFTIPRLARFKTDFTISSNVPLRAFLFTEEMKKRGAVCSALHSFAGFTNHIKIDIHGKTFRFDGFPTAEFASKYDSRITDDKVLAKDHCKVGGFPIAEGRSFWFWQKSKAVRFGSNLGFPLVVKPRGGSVSRHVTTNIINAEQLKKAIRHAIAYSPSLIVERFIPNTSVIRATVVDFDFVACVKQVPANIVGDGVSTIRTLIDLKNLDPRRGETHQNQFVLNKIVRNETTKILLNEKGYGIDSIPKKGEIVYLQRDPFLKLGGDLVELTPTVHPDNIKLFKDLANHFDIRITGIDFLAEDISKSWKEQSCAILELNSLPCIELHHFPYSGAPTNPAGALADMFTKYYLTA
jgi:cyanophycin synthetase